MKTNLTRVNRTKAQARQNYNRLSRWYDWLAGSSEEVYRQRGIKALAAQPGEDIFEIGFGTGHALVAIAGEVRPGGHVFGIDISDGMIQIAKNRISQNQLEEQIHLTLADGAFIPFSANQLDAVFMSFTLELFDTPEIHQVLYQCHRILKSNGRLVNVSLEKTNAPGFAESLYEWFHQKMPVVIDCRPINARTALIEAGFEISEIIRKSMWGLPVQITLAYCKG